MTIHIYFYFYFWLVYELRLMQLLTNFKVYCLLIICTLLVLLTLEPPSQHTKDGNWSWHCSVYKYVLIILLLRVSSFSRAVWRDWTGMTEFFLKPATCFDISYWILDGGYWFGIFLACSMWWVGGRGPGEGRLEVLPILFSHYTIYEEVYTWVYENSAMPNLIQNLNPF